MEIIVGTAGHIDHGKTALVKALTGVDADRLPEEKRRGITVDLGFAEMSVGDSHFGFVDVPGHERFVKNMLAGASGIDVVLLVIAADEGVMPQTREHFDICRLLGVKAGIVVLTKSDLVDAETLDLARLDAAELVANSPLEDAPVIPVSSKTGQGIDDLKHALQQIGTNLPGRKDELITRLPIDRSFSVKGFGAVATGTLSSGTILEGDQMELLPSGTKVRVRGLQTHGQSVKSASAGQRVAVNLGGIDHGKVTRGMVLAEPNILRPTQIFDAEIEVLRGAARPVRSRQRVRVHVGTTEALARIQVLNKTGEIAAGETDFAQVRLEVAVAAVPRERFIIRSYSPQHTIAGGIVIETFSLKHRRKEIEAIRSRLKEQLSASEDNNALVGLLVRVAGMEGLTFAELQSRTALRRDLLIKALNTNLDSGVFVEADGRYMERNAFDSLVRSAVAAVSRFHEQVPLARGISREALSERLVAHLPSEIFQAVVASLESAGTFLVDKDLIRLASYRTTLSPGQTALGEKILARYKTSRLEVPKLEDALAEAIVGTNFTRQEARKFFQLFLDSRDIVKVTEEFYFAKSVLDDLIGQVRQFAADSPDGLIDVAKFKELAGISRKYAIPLLEYFDRERITRRAGDKRLIL